VDKRSNSTPKLKPGELFPGGEVVPQYFRRFQWAGRVDGLRMALECERARFRYALRPGGNATLDERTRGDWKAYRHECKKHKALIDGTIKLLGSSFEAARKFVGSQAKPPQETEKWIAENGGFFDVDGMGWAIAYFSRVVPTLFFLFDDSAAAFTALGPHITAAGEVTDLDSPSYWLRYTFVPWVHVRRAFTIWGKWAFLNPETASAFYDSPSDLRPQLIACIEPDSERKTPKRVGAPKSGRKRVIKQAITDRVVEEIKNDLPNAPGPAQLAHAVEVLGRAKKNSRRTRKKEKFDTGTASAHGITPNYAGKLRREILEQRRKK
jgi:hypothetical protein